MRLDDIGFYTLSDKRAAEASSTTPLTRCELLITDTCNFKCTYCRGMVVKGHMSPEQARKTLQLWCNDGLQNVRFSGGEPTLYPHLQWCVELCQSWGVKRIAVSTNGSAPLSQYKRLVDAGVNDLSVSLDACCAADGDAIAHRNGSWAKTVANIREMVKMCYTTVGIVVTSRNVKKIKDTINLCVNLGVNDVRVIPAAQESDIAMNLDDFGCAGMPILDYRLSRIRNHQPVRGIPRYASDRCRLVLDDMTVMGDKHYSCIIALREGAPPIGEVGPQMREERLMWSQIHNTHIDRICKVNCLDVCVAYNDEARREATRDGE